MMQQLLSLTGPGVEQVLMSANIVKQFLKRSGCPIVRLQVTQISLGMNTTMSMISLLLWVDWRKSHQASKPVPKHSLLALTGQAALSKSS